MPYATQQDLIDRFGEEELVQLTDKTNIPPSTIDAVPVDRALSDAAALIDSYLAKLYRLPLSAVPQILTKASADIARFFLYGKSAEETVTNAYKDAVTWLTSISKGLVTLDAEGVAPAEAGNGQVQSRAPRRVFSRDSLRNA
jgi:phage gp36-like protein